MQITNINSLKKYWLIEDIPVLHRNVANLVYFANVGGIDAVIRLTPVSQRTDVEIQAELEWMNELHETKLQTAEIIFSTEAKLFHTLNINNLNFHVVVFKKIDGSRIDENKISETDLTQWAYSLAFMHKNSLARPIDPRRKDWSNDSILHKSLSALDRSSKEASEKFLNIIELLKNTPRDQHYGLVHGDLHAGSFFKTNTGLTIFDFDDCCYHWFLYDLTIPILSIYKSSDIHENLDYKKQKIRFFLKKYFDNFQQISNFKQDFTKFIQFRLLLVHYWLLAIRTERELTQEMANHFQEAIEDDLYLAFHPELFDFIYDGV